MQTGHDLELAQQRLGDELADIESGRGTSADADTVSLSDAALKAAQEHEGATAADILTYLSREFGVTVRANHLGITLHRHRRAGRLETRDERWYLPHSAQSKRSA
jgi:hypothetical protein